MVLDDGVLQPRPIGDVVAQAAARVRRRLRSRHLRGRLPRDHRLVRGSGRSDLRDRARSGRRVRVTAGHNLFTLDRDGRIRKVRTAELGAGVRVAVPAPHPRSGLRTHHDPLFDVIPESAYAASSARARRSRTRSPTAETTRASCCATTGTGTPTTTRARARLPDAPGRASSTVSFDDMGPGRSDPHQGRALRDSRPTLARRSRVRVAARDLRRGGLPPPSRSSSCRTPTRRSSTGSKRCCTASVFRCTARAARSRAARRSRRACSSGSAPAGRPPRSGSRRRSSVWPHRAPRGVPRGPCRRRRKRRGHPYLGVDDLRRARRRSARAVRPARATRGHVVARPRSCADLPGLRADRRAQAPHQRAAPRPAPRRAARTRRARPASTASRAAGYKNATRPQQHRAPLRTWTRCGSRRCVARATRTRARARRRRSSLASIAWSTAICSGTRSSRYATPGSPRRSSTSRCGRADATSRTSSPARWRVRVQHRGLRRCRLGRPPHARAVERRQPADRAVPGDEDRADLVPAHDHRGRAPVREPEHRLEVPGPTGPHAVPLLPQLPRRRVAPGRCPTEPMRVGGHRAADGRLPRRRVGRAHPRRRRAVRAAHARGRAGRAQLAHDPQQARGLPRRVRGLRPGAGRRRTPNATSSGCSAMPASCGTAARSSRRSTTRSASSRCRTTSAASTPTCGRSSTARRSSADGSSSGELPSSTPQSVALSRDLKRRGFRFVGPTTVYAFMQAAGLVDDHVVTCFRYRGA